MNIYVTYNSQKLIIYNIMMQAKIICETLWKFLCRISCVFTSQKLIWYPVLWVYMCFFKFVDNFVNTFIHTDTRCIVWYGSDGWRGWIFFHNKTVFYYCVQIPIIQAILPGKYEFPHAFQHPVVCWIFPLRRCFSFLLFCLHAFSNMQVQMKQLQYSSRLSYQIK